MPSNGTYPHAFCVFVFLSLAVSHSLCHTPSLSPNTFVDCCFDRSLRWLSCLYLSLVVARCQLSSLVVTGRRSLSLVVARHLTVSLMHAHTHSHSLPLIKHSLSLSLVDCCFSFVFFRLRHCCSWHFRSSHPSSILRHSSSPSISPFPPHTVAMYSTVVYLPLHFTPRVGPTK